MSTHLWLYVFVIASSVALVAISLWRRSPWEGAGGAVSGLAWIAMFWMELNGARLWLEIAVGVLLLATIGCGVQFLRTGRPVPQDLRSR